MVETISVLTHHTTSYSVANSPKFYLIPVTTRKKKKTAITSEGLPYFTSFEASVVLHLITLFF